MKIASRNIAEIVKLGYTFNQPLSASGKFIANHFKALDIVTLAKDLERLLTPHAPPPLTREINLTEPPPVLRIEYKSKNHLDEAKGLYLVRSFS